MLPERCPDVAGFAVRISRNTQGVCLIGVLWSNTYYQINHDYDRTIAEASTETMNLAIAYEEHVRRVVADADKDLLSLKKAYEQGGVSSPIFVAFAQHAAQDNSRNQVAVYNEQGDVIESRIQNALGVNRSDREYFLVHRDANSQTLYIGRMIVSRVSAQNIIPLTRRINKPDGSFGGIVYLGLKTDFFLDFYKNMDLGKDQLITLAGLDGIIRARQSGDNFETGQDLTNSALWKNLQISPYGTYTANTNSDGIPRILSYRVMPDFPLVFTIGKTTKAALADYEQRKQGYIVRASLGSLVLAVICILLVDRVAKQRALHVELEKRVDERTQELMARDKALSEVNRQLIETSAAVQQERDWLSALINSMSDEVWFADTGKRLILVNPLTPQEFSNAVSDKINIEDLFACYGVLRPDGSLRPMEESPTLRALQGEVIKNQLEIARSFATGEKCYREVNANPVKDAKGKIIGAVAIARDITERKQMENDLIQHRDNLEKLVKERTEEVLRLDRLNLVGEMSAAIGHEVRNPLTTVRGYLQLFYKKEKYVEHREQFETMIEELDRANSIISEFLSLAKDKKIALKPTYLNATIRQVLPLLQAAAIREDKEIATVFTDVPKIIVDENEIRQIVLNLTRNALDAIQPGGVVTISTILDKRRKTVSLSVKDTGTGIPPSVLETLGKPFVTTKATGTGLGLPICYRIAERHNAKILVDTGLTGTTISIIFPLIDPV